MPYINVNISFKITNNNFFSADVNDIRTLVQWYDLYLVTTTLNVSMNVPARSVSNVFWDIKMVKTDFVLNNLEGIVDFAVNLKAFESKILNSNVIFYFSISHANSKDISPFQLMSVLAIWIFF